MSPSSSALQRARSWLLAVAVALAGHLLLLGPRAPASVRAPPALQAWLRVAPTPTLAPTPATVAQQARPAARHLGPQPPTVSKPAPAPTQPLSVAPSLEWTYSLRQNGRDGRARLRWQVEGSAYRLQLERWLDDRALPGWRSAGQLAADGLAPSRYAELRGEREARATNFRRDEGLISFSASSELVALAEATQDHISWWLQLAALATARTPQPGVEIHVPVVGLRGEPTVWVFETLGMEEGLLHLRRPALSEWDGALDVWLDPAHHHLPVRLQSGDPDSHGWRLDLDGPAHGD